MTLTISPAQLKGTLRIPSSKSATHRAMICAFLAGGAPVLHGLACDDSRATAACLATLQNGGGEMPCHESGSTLRFMLPLAAAVGGAYRFTGTKVLLSRAMGEMLDLLASRGIQVHSSPDAITISGKLTGGDFMLDGRISSQFTSGLLMALPLLGGRVHPGHNPVSISYIDMTREMMRNFGVDTHMDQEGFYTAQGSYTRDTVSVEGDWSQAAFFLCAKAWGHDITLKGLREDSLQGDRAILHALGQAGTTIDVSQCPDLVPILCVHYALSPGTTRITGAARLRFKECDRLSAMAHELSILGAKIEEDIDDLVITGRERLLGGEVKSWSDHRIAMALSIAALRSKDAIILHGAEHVSKSYPDYWEDYASLGGKFTAQEA